MGRTGREQGTLGAAGVNEGPSLSADEKRLTVSRFEPATNMDLWTIDLSRNVAERLTADPGFEFHAVWSPDAEQVAFNSSRKGRFGIYRKPASGIGADQLLFAPPSNAVPHDWTPDGRSVLAEFSGDIWVVPVSGDQPFALLQTRFNETQPRVSPDGRWVAYTSDETGAPEVYVQEFRKAGKRWRISTHGGLDPRWRGDGREIFYLEPGPPSAASHVAEPMLIAVGVRSGSTFEPGPPQSALPGARAGRVDALNEDLCCRLPGSALPLRQGRGGRAVPDHRRSQLEGRALSVRVKGLRDQRVTAAIYESANGGALVKLAAAR